MYVCMYVYIYISVCVVCVRVYVYLYTDLKDLVHDIGTLVLNCHDLLVDRL